VAIGETVYEVNARWTAVGRRSARRPGKTDRLDAQSVARVVRQEGATLPAVFAEDDSAVLDVLANERDEVLREETRLRNQIHALLLQIDPLYRDRLPKLTSKAGLRALAAYRSGDLGDGIQAQRAAAVRRIGARLQLASAQADDLARQLRRLAAPGYSPLTQLFGVNLLTAAALAGVLGPGQRFSTDSQLAAYAGVAPLETSSASLVRHRLNRGGNRRLNSIIY
jgi:transposase